MIALNLLLEIPKKVQESNKINKLLRDDGDE